MSAKSPEFVYICQPPINLGGGSLKGLRLGVKDLFQIANLPTSAGNPDWLASHVQPSQDTASSVMALLEAGATLIGKTLTDELAYSLEGINQHYGTPINPQAPNRLPGGSSSGSAVAVANGSIDLGLGTDTGGSIRVPASYNGLYGLRPSHGVVNSDRLIPLAPRFDTVGWMTRDFSTMMRTADVLLPKSDEKNLSRLVIAELPEIPAWQTAREAIATQIASLFASVSYVSLTQNFFTRASAAFRVLQGREIWQSHGEWIEQQQPNFASEIGDRFDWCQSLSAKDELQAETEAKAIVEFWHQNIIPNHDTVLVLPTTPSAAPLLNTPPAELKQYRKHLLGMTAPAGLTGSPQITLPYLKSDRAPWGISLIARPHLDRALLSLVSRIDKLIDAS